MNLKLKKIDIIIIVALIIIAGTVVLKVDYIPKKIDKDIPIIEFAQDEDDYKLVVTYVSDIIKWSELEIIGDCDKSQLSTYVVTDDEIAKCRDAITIKYKSNGEIIGKWTFTYEETPPISLESELIGRGVSPEDEGEHFNKLGVNREWWTWTGIFDKESELAGWTVTISFMYMGLTDLPGTLKPDILTIVLHSPDGDEYGGMINKKRGGIIWESTLKALTPNVNLKYEDSWAEKHPDYPGWKLHIEDDDIDKDNEIVVNLDYFAPSPAIWLHASNYFLKGKSRIDGSYIFAGCEIKGTVSIDGKTYSVSGIGHHEHTWSTGIIKSVVRGWDICNIQLDNGWNIYYSNYYMSSQLTSTRTYKASPFSTVIITTDQGKTITKLNDVEIGIENSERLSLLLKRPTDFKIHAKPGLAQALLRTYYVNLELELSVGENYQKIFRSLQTLGMNIGQSTVSGQIYWYDEDGDHTVELSGHANIWTMRH